MVVVITIELLLVVVEVVIVILIGDRDGAGGANNDGDGGGDEVDDGWNIANGSRFRFRDEGRGDNGSSNSRRYPYTDPHC